MAQHDSTCSSGCTCAEDVARSFAEHAQHNDEMVLYQTSMMSALIDGVYDGDVTMRELLEHGDFGLGTFNNLDGELIAFDSNIHHLYPDGTAQEADPEEKTPFACMTFFKPTIERDLDESMSHKDVEALIDSLVDTANLFCAIRIDGEFEVVKTRTVPRQEPPYKPMLQAIANQPIFEFNECSGVLAGFRSPEYVQGMNVAGYHIHFITDERSGGGHVTEYRLKRGRLQMGVISKLYVDLPRNAAFGKAHLNPEDLDKAIREAEG